MRRIQIDIDLKQKIEPDQAIKECLKTEWNIELPINTPIFWGRIIIDNENST